jgi:hypothetical protein
MLATANSGQQFAIFQEASSPSVQRTRTSKRTRLDDQVGSAASKPHSEHLSQGSSNTALVKAIAAGDRCAMQMLYMRHNVRVYRFILRLTNDNPSLAEDLVKRGFSRRLAPSRGLPSKVASFYLVIGHCPKQVAFSTEASLR